MPKEGDEFILEFSRFYQGFSPDAHLDSLSEFGNKGHASAMTDCDVLNPRYVTQGPGLSALTNGTQAGVVSELINFILEQPPASNATYAVGATKLFQLSATAVSSGGSPNWPVTITNCTDGESIVVLAGVLYTLYK